MFMAYTGDLNLARDAKISGFVVCSKSNIHGESSNIDCGEIFAPDVNSLFVCGHLNTSNKEETGISIYLFRNELEAPIYSSPVNLHLSKGKFCQEIALPTHNKRGSYSVKVYYFRRVIASTAFEVR